MPWSIWPSLVVLWGVCWMFYTPFNTLDATRFERYFDDEQLSPFVPGKTSHAYVNVENIDGRVVEVAFDPEFASYSSGLEYFPGTFESEIEFNDATYSSHIDQNGLKGYNLSPFEQQFVAQVSSGNAVGSGSLPSFGSRLNETSSSTAGHMNESTQQAADAPRSQLYVNRSQSTNISQTTHLDEQHIASSSAVAMIVPTDLETMLPQQASTESEQQQSPLRNAEGKLICTYIGCDRNKIFRRHCDWKTHMNKHTRPFRCSVQGCRGSSGFATKGVLDRHVYRVHQRSSSALSEASRVVEIEGASAESDMVETSLNLTDQSLVLLSKGKGRSKRVFTEETGGQETGEEQGECSSSTSNSKKVKVAEQGSSDTQQISQREKDLAKENKQLEQLLDKANEELKRCQEEREKEREMMLGIIDRLTKRGN